MESWLVVSLGGLACVALTILVAVPGWLISWYLRYRKRATTDAHAAEHLRKLANHRGLQPANGGGGLRVAYEGRIPLVPGGPPRQLRAAVREAPFDGDTRLLLGFATHVPSGSLALEHRALRAASEGDDGLVVGVPPPTGTEIGDPSFDVRFALNASIEDLSLLLAPVRAALLHAAEDAAVRIDDGWVWVEMPGTVEEFSNSTERFARLDAVAVAFERVPTAVDSRIRALAQDDLGKVRLRTLERVAARGAGEFARWLSSVLLTDPDVEVRVRAAELSGEPGRMLELARDPAIPARYRARLGRILAEGGRPADRLELARALTRKGDGPVDPTLLDVAVELCRPLGSDAEPLLLEIVHESPDWIARRVVSILGDTGSARSMVVLRAVSEAERAGIVRSEARLALARLQGRATRARAGAHHGHHAHDGDVTRTTPLNAVPTGTARALSSQPPRRGGLPRKPER